MSEPAKRVAILQSNYIPWKGYFDLINTVDLFVFHDDLQYTKGDWRNRNRIKTPEGTKWLTIPCGTDEKRLISEVALRDHNWQREHWRRIVGSYGRAPFFQTHAGFFEDAYLGREWDNLSELNQHLIKHICRDWLHIDTQFDDSRNYSLTSRKAARVMELLGRVGATEYVSGPAARAYLDETAFERSGIGLTWMTYSGYRQYEQLYPPFDHNVSIIDLLFSAGQDAPNYMNSFA